MKLDNDVGFMLNFAEEPKVMLKVRKEVGKKCKFIFINMLTQYNLEIPFKNIKYSCS